MYLYLVRHGESVGNVKKLFFGQWDCPLTELGRQQAWTVAEKLRAVEFECCFASDLQRAWETAEICLTGRLIMPELCPALREQDLGSLECKTWDEAQALYSTYLDGYLNNWYHSSVPTVECPKDMKRRIAACVVRRHRPSA